MDTQESQNIIPVIARSASDAAISPSTGFTHKSVLLDEVVSIFDYCHPERFCHPELVSGSSILIDGTLGLAGHSIALMMANPGLHLIGIDQDNQALAGANINLKEADLYKRTYLSQNNFSDMKDSYQDAIKKNTSWKKFPVQCILLDIGVSSLQLDDAERGFAFKTNGPLDMRMDQINNTVTAATIVNTWNEHRMADLFYEYGEERLSRKIARMIVERRKKLFTETQELAEFIAQIFPVKQRFGRIHPATRVFQALRIEVNQELESLKSGIKEATDLLSPGGRLAIISFHSLEDRIVKHTFRELAGIQNKDTNQESPALFKLVTKKAIVPTEEEIKMNPRSRSAKLRVIEKL